MFKALNNIVSQQSDAPTLLNINVQQNWTNLHIYEMISIETLYIWST